jgi:hypothetical protein
MEAQHHADSLVTRLRGEAAAIVSRAVGDLTALETASSVSETPASLAPWAPSEDQPESEEKLAEWVTPSSQESQPEESSAERSSLDPNEEAPQAAEDEPAGDAVWTGPAVGEWEPAPQMSPEVAANGDRPGESATDQVAPDVVAQDQAPAEPAEPGPFQWLRSALAGRDGSQRTGGAEQVAEGPFANETPFTPLVPHSAAERPDAGADDTFITRLTIHPAFTHPEREMLERRIEGLTGVAGVAFGSVAEDFFELLVTDQLYTSVLGSLLTAAGENIRLIAQHDDSLEVEITGLDWVRVGEDAAETSRATDG